MGETGPGSQGTGPAPQGGVVVVAEDFDDVSELYTQWFEEAGFVVVEAADGESAVAASKARRVDAFVMDLQMPHMDGWEAIGRIREHVGPSPYILAVSAHIQSDVSRKAAYEAGADDLVAKPIEPGVLVTIVRAALRTRR